MTLEAIEPGRGGAHTPSVKIHHFTKEEIDRRDKEVNNNGK
jgi:hypothetical protein